MTEKKLKICHVTSMHNWNDDRIFERACVGLASLGHDVTLIAPAPESGIREGVKIKAIPLRGRVAKHLIGPFEAYHKLKKVDADIYHFYNPNMMLLMAHWARTGRKVFIDIHENYESRVDALPLPKFLKPWAIKQYRNFENWCSSSYSGITVVTQSMKNKLRSSGVPILLVDNVPYLNRLSAVRLSNDKSTRPTIITSGSHSEARNCMQAVDALPQIIKKIPNVKMKFVGRFHPPEYEERLKRRSKDLGVEDHLEMEGMLPWLENFHRISLAHVGCVFYNGNLNNRVTLPNRLYEYMYCGLAVLGEDFPEVRKVMKNSNGGICVDSQNPGDIAEKAVKLLQDLPKLEQMGTQAKHAVEKKYNFERVLEALVEFYYSSLKE